MSALRLYQIAAGRCCAEPACTNSGRYQIILAGRHCESKYGPEVLCKKHADLFERLFGELAPSEQDVLATIEAIRGTAIERMDAITLLRGMGLSPEHVAQIVKAVAERVPVERVLERIAGEAVPA